VSSTVVFDAHVHVDKGLDGYDLEVSGKNLIFNDVDSYRRSCERYRTASDAVSLILDLGPDRDFVLGEARAGRIDAVKIHSRIQRIGASEWPTVARVLAEVPPDIPAIVDGFYFGGDMEHQPSLAALIDLLAAFPQRRFVVAHSGGYRILEYFFHLRPFANVYYELALSLQYLEDSSASADVRKLVRHTDTAKILFGSDYPFGSPARQRDILAGVCAEVGLSDGEAERLFYRNAAELFKKDVR